MILSFVFIQPNILIHLKISTTLIHKNYDKYADINKILALHITATAKNDRKIHLVLFLYSMPEK
ncbi:hypothetical protein A3N58_00275 [Klebsiella aerogenes]|nr:hypothetical protein SR67_19490 [Klebsiella aerogenes]KZQ49280.1 hypothetical protein A3N58_00275 [Klebsiella aerogenes]